MINSETIKNLRELMRMKEELEAEITAAQDQIKAALKKALPDVVAQYTKVTTSRRFCLA